jgi:small subunit ribosomal protein S16
MAVKIRLQRHGRGKRPFYHIVASDSRTKRDGKYIERLGDYNPLTSPATIHLDVDKTVDWLLKGAEPTDTVHAILKYKGATFKKHLQRGVEKGALTQEAADKKFAEWVETHQNAVLDHKKKLHVSKDDRLKKLMEEETKKKNDREAKRQAALDALNAVPSKEAAAEAEAPAENTEAPASDAPVENTEAPAAE